VLLSDLILTFGIGAARTEPVRKTTLLRPECEMIFSTLISYILLILSITIGIPTAVLCIEIAAAGIRRHGPHSLVDRERRPRIAVLVPAHNESTTIVPTLADITAQMLPDDRLLVVADNCSDDTASVARTLGAEVIERHDISRIGKGYALDWGLRHLELDPPEIVVTIDADCTLGDGAIDRLATKCSSSGRPVQGLYLMNLSGDQRVNKQIAAFAWRIKNWARPCGLYNLGLSCQLTGSGMAFPWPVIHAVDLASGWIVEDLKLGLDLAAADHPPLFCPTARFASQFAVSADGSANQRKRWEHGHVMTIVKMAPHYFYVALTSRNLNLLTLTLDLIVPPLSLLAMLLVLIFVATGIGALLGFGINAFIVSAVCLASFVGALGFAWDSYGREVLPARAIWSVPSYVFTKLGLYRQLFAQRRTTQWIRTNRSNE
jgi:cellulose synthase/poly-beta-1,6-N-acetylglucosamine synthase-like glycosyltransferase